MEPPLFRATIERAAATEAAEISGSIENRTCLDSSRQGMSGKAASVIALGTKP
jgi:hypothetical protein